MTDPRLPHGLDPEYGNAPSAEAVREALGHWRAVIDAIRDPIFIHDTQFRILRVNAAYAEWAGMAIDELVGRVYWEVFPHGDGPCRAAAPPWTRFKRNRSRSPPLPARSSCSAPFPSWTTRASPCSPSTSWRR
ncbi:MAG: PAS domain-containing protein [Thiohalorhabdaceae bacterium]